MLSRVLCLALLASSSVLGIQAQNSLTVETDKGSVSGYSSGNVDKWRGIPYASPPVGNLRFAVPEPAAPWSGVKSATSPGPICPQLHGLIPGLWSGEEDCLYADVYAPSGRDITKPLPVLVWIYGGGWDLGDGIEFGLYDATNLVNLHDIIFVSFNYRLGPLGFLALPGAKAENAQGSVGSYGIYDQIAALKWVQTNIAAFGGDPTAVTIAGESAGAFSNCIHIASPLSKGLFRSAILESGTCSSSIFFQTQESSLAWSDTFANITGCSDSQESDAEVLECARALDLNQIMGAGLLNYTDTGYFPPMFPVLPWGATIDGVLLTATPFEVMSSGEANEVGSVLMGTNHDEGTLFVARLKEVIPDLHAPLQSGDIDLILNHFFGNNATVNAVVDPAYPIENYSNATQQIEVMLRDFFFLCPSSRALLALGSFGANTWMYQFVYHGDWIEDPFLGVYHSAELEFVFDNAWPPIIHTFSARDQTMANTFGYYWTNMVKYGNPNGPSPSGAQIEWPQYQSGSMQNIALDVPPTLNINLQEDKCAVWDTIAAWTPPVTIQRMRKFVEMA